jgi:uncharacterized protein (TIGR00369 family)
LDSTPFKGLAPFDPAEKSHRIAQQSRQSYFDFLGLRLVDLEPGYARLELPFRPEFTHSARVVQGGLITTLADAAIAHALVAAVHGEKLTTTVELKINFIRPATGGTFTAEARLLHLGSRTAVGEAEILDEQGRLIAKCLSSLMLLPLENG